jgi:hypothetical protein
VHMTHAVYDAADAPVLLHVASKRGPRDRIDRSIDSVFLCETET